MKKIALTTFLAFSICFFAFSQEKGKAHPHKDKDPKERAEHIADRLKEDLGLTQEQRNRILNLNTRKFMDMKALDDKYEGNRKEHEEEYKALRDQYIKNLEDVLTPEQMTKFKEKHHGKNKHGHAHPHEDDDHEMQQRPPSNDVEPIDN